MRVRGVRAGTRTARSLVALSLVAALAAACTSPAPTEGDDEPTGENSTDGEEVVVTMWHYQDFWKTAENVGQQRLAEFNQAHEGEIRVELTFFPFEQYQSVLQTSLSSGDLADIVAMPQLDLMSLYEQGLLLPLNDIVPSGWADQFAEGAFAEGINMVGDEYYSWPERGPWHRGLMYFNREVMAQAGLDPNAPPQTWDELKDMCVQVAEAGNGEYYGIIIGGQDDGINIIETLALTMDSSMDGDWSSKPLSFFDYTTGEFVADSESMAAAAELVFDLEDSGCVVPGTMNRDKATAHGLWAENSAAFVFEPQWLINAVKRDFPDTDFGVATMPVPELGQDAYFSTGFARGDYVVSASTENPEAVGVVIDELLTGPAAFQNFISNGIVLSASEEWNSREDLYPNEEFATYVKLSNEDVTISPVPAAFNPDVAQVLSAMVIAPTKTEFLQQLYTRGRGSISTVLADYDAILESALDAAIEQAVSGGAQVSRDDFTFADWDPSRNYVSK